MRGKSHLKFLVLRFLADWQNADQQSVDRQNVDKGKYDNTSTCFNVNMIFMSTCL